MRNNRAAQGALLALVSAALWGISGAVAGGVFDVVSPARVAQSRAFIAVALLVPFAALRGQLRPRGGMAKLAVLGINLALVNVTFYWALDLLGVGPGATIQFLGPILVLIWMVFVKNQKVRSLVWVAAVAAVVGVAMVTEAWTLDGGDLLGVAAGLAAALTFAFYLLYGEHLAASFDPIYITTWGFIFTAAFWLLVLPVWTFPTGLSGGAWRDLIIIGVLGTAVPFILEIRALSLVASSIVGVVATLEPAIGAVAASIMLDQFLDPVQWVGVAVVVFAVASVQAWGLPEDQPAVPVVS